MNYIFYDTETTGLDTTFDQILQFAAILTDENLKELDRFEVRCQLHPHVVPSPGALLATRVTPATLTDPRLPTHFEMMRVIGDKLRAWSPAILTGYHSLSFDETLLRQAFYQTLQPVYLTNTNGNKRADVLHLVQATAALSDGAMVVPISDKGKPTLRLDALAPANGFAHENAHDALADVEATIHMARLVLNSAPAVWNALMPLVDKSEVTARLMTGEPTCLVAYHMGVPSVRAVIGCGQHPNNPTMLGAFDLSRDPADILCLDEDDLVKEMNGPNRALRVVYSNKQPLVVEMGMASNLTEKINLPLHEIERRAAAVAADKQFAERVGLAMLQRYPPFEPSQVVEKRMYDGFPSRDDEARMMAFQRASWAERADLIETFNDDRLRELGRRLVYFEAPELLKPEQRSSLDTWLQNRKQGREGIEAGRTVEAALAEIEELNNDNTASRDAVAVIREWLLD